MNKENTMHPGEFLLEAYIKPMGLTVNGVAGDIGVSGSTLSRLINKKSSMTPSMALKLEGKFNRSAESWLLLQSRYDIKFADSLRHVDKVLKVEIPKFNVSITQSDELGLYRGEVNMPNGSFDFYAKDIDGLIGEMRTSLGEFLDVTKDIAE